MTKNEFESLTGLTVNAAEYHSIELVYMAEDNMDKKEFCNMWVNTPEPAQDYMIDMARKLAQTTIDAKCAVATLINEKNKMLDVMFERTQVMSDSELRKACIKHMGGKEYIKRLIKSGHPLWEADQELLLELLG